MNITINGAGIGGLTAAIAFSQAGHNVDVFEQTVEPKPVGAGIGLQPNALFALGTLGLVKDVTQRAYASLSAHLRYSSGKTIRRFDFRPYEEMYGFVPHTIHRADLFDALYRAATASGVRVGFGQSVQTFQDVGSRVNVKVSDQDLECDALIGADGINSAIRTQLWGESPPRYSGYVCWRGIVTDVSVVEQITEMNEVWGHGARFGFMRCSQDKVYWYAARNCKQTVRPDVSWRDWFCHWPSPIRELLDATPEDQIAFNEICDRNPFSPWGKGRVTLLGDAAHPMTPNFGQGGAQAIEDAIVLAKVLKGCPDPVAPFRQYERLRWKRTSRLVRSSRSFGYVAQGGTCFARLIRDRILPLIPESATNKKLGDQLNAEPHLQV